jgi:hypothetical protein
MNKCTHIVGVVKVGNKLDYHINLAWGRIKNNKIAVLKIKKISQNDKLPTTLCRSVARHKWSGRLKNNMFYT